ncbi:MAG: hypothetical protein AAGK04_06025 [Planctomycetota bacterium]
MSHSLEVIVDPKASLPAPKAWNEAIASLGYDMTLDDFDWDTFSGFLPCRLVGVSTGFELFKDVERHKKGWFKKPLAYVQISLVLGSRWIETVAASVAQQALVKLTRGRGAYEGDPLSEEDLAEGSRDLYVNLQYMLALFAVDDAGLPANEPPLFEPFETDQQRTAMIERLLSARDVRRVEETGNIRLSKRAREDLLKLTEG